MILSKVKYKPLSKQIIINVLHRYATHQNININTACLELIYYYNCYLLDIDYQGIRTAINFLNEIGKEHKITNKPICKDLLKTVLIKHHNVTPKQLNSIDKYLL